MLKRLSWSVLGLGVLALIVAQWLRGSHDDERPADVLTDANTVVAAFQASDGERLARLVHPQFGVRFSPSAFVDLNQDAVLTPAQVSTLWTDSSIRTWGHAEGSGEPIRLTAAAFVQRYVLRQDFSRLTAITVNTHLTRGTTANNAAEVYPHATIVEYYTDEAENGTGNWYALRVAFAELDGAWKLIAVITDSWSV